MLTRAYKRCQRCGAVQLVRARMRRCKQPRGMLGTYACWGQLVRVEQAAPQRAAQRKGARMAQPKRPQDVALRKLEIARKKIAEKTRAMATLAQSLADWQRRANYYAKRASMTDEEVRAESERAKAAAAKGRARRRIRGIDLTGGEI